MASEIEHSKGVNIQNRGLNKSQLSRMLLVNNIGDTELKALFELYGDPQTFYSLSRNHGFIIMSYYDIRAAQNAEMMLQARTIKGQKFDIQFYVKDIYSESKTSDDVLLVTNINTSVSNDDLLHIFGRIGEIKEIREISQNWQYKTIEFYDVRPADAAISALNGCDIAGKRIQVEPWCLRDSRFISIQKSTLDIEGEESGRFRHEIYPKKMLLECYGTSSYHQNGVIHGSFGIPYNIPRHIPSQTISLKPKNLAFCRFRGSLLFSSSLSLRLSSDLFSSIAEKIRIFSSSGFSSFKSHTIQLVHPFITKKFNLHKANSLFSNSILYSTNSKPN